MEFGKMEHPPETRVSVLVIHKPCLYESLRVISLIGTREKHIRLGTKDQLSNTSSRNVKVNKLINK